MIQQALGTNDVVSQAVDKYSDMVRRICFMYLKNHADVEDVFQEVFLKLLQNQSNFYNQDHEKAWLCTVTFNKCKDLCKSYWKKHVHSIENQEISYEAPEISSLMSAISALPHKYKTIIYLHYCEGYSIPEIASITQQNENSAYTQLRRAKKALKDFMKEDLNCE